ncbi:MAG: NRDE family protein [Kofleriaceae bacterium]
MCTIAILIGVTEAPVVLAANRDEIYARPTRPPERLGPGLVGGRDVLSGGTWLALHATGRFAAVTNQRVLDQPPTGLRSRGLAVVECADAADQDAYVRALDPRDYASMNLVFGSGSGVTIAYLRRDDGGRELVRLGPGIHVLCNDRLGTSEFPRGDRLRVSIEAALETGTAWPALWPRLAQALGDHQRVALADTPPSPGLSREVANELTAICIHTELYGTRSASLVALEDHRVAAYRASDGPPGETAFTDRMALFEDPGE